MRTFLLTTILSMLSILASFAVPGIVNIDTTTYYTVYANETDTLVDDGGLAGNYSPNKSRKVTITPDMYQYLMLDFKSFDLSSGDTLFVYNGPDTSYSQVTGSPFVMGSVVNHVFASYTGQALTVKFTTDGSNQSSGFVIELFSSTTLSCPTLMTPSNGATGVSQTPYFEWAASPHASGYIINVNETYGSYSYTDTIYGTSFTLPESLKQKTEYNWRALPINQFMNQFECPQYSFTTLCSPMPSKPVIGGPDTINVSTDNVILTSSVAVGTEDAKWNISGYSPSDFVFTNLENSTTTLYGRKNYIYSVTREHDNGICINSDTVVVKFLPDLNTDLKLWYKFEQNDSARNTADDFYNLEFYGTHSSQPDTFGGNSAMLFSGNGHANISYYPSELSFTAATWFKILTPGTNMCLLDMSGKAGLFYEIDGKFHLRTNYASPMCTTYVSDLATPVMSATSWTHVAVVCNGNSQKIFVDGALQASQTLIYSELGYSVCDSFSVGRKNMGDSAYISGNLDELRYYGRALSDAEVTNLYNLLPCTTAQPTVTGSLDVYTPDGQAKLTASGGVEYRWYLSSRGFIAHVGPTYDLNYINSNQSIWVTNFDGCESERKKVDIVYHDRNQGLYGYYPFNGSISKADGYGVNGTQYNVSFGNDKNGIANNAAVFSNNAYIQYDTSYIHREFSILMYCKADSIKNSALFSKNNVLKIHLNAADSTISVDNNLGQQCGTMNTNVLQSATSITTNQWYQIAYTRDTAGHERLYINSALDATDSLNADSTFMNCMSNRMLGNSISSEPFYGSIDEVRMYDRALTPDEIAFFYNECTTPAPLKDTIYRVGYGRVSMHVNGSNIKWYNDLYDTTVLMNGNDYITPYLSYSKTYYVSQTIGCESKRVSIVADPSLTINSFLSLYIPFTNSSLSDSSGNGYIITDYSTELGMDRFGTPNMGRYFNNSSEYFEVPSLPEYGNVTMASWFYSPNSHAHDVVIMETQDSVGLRIGTDNKLKGIIKLTSGFYTLTSPDTVNDTKHYHAALTYNGNMAVLYLNGEPVDTLSDNSGVFSTSNLGLYVGNDYNSVSNLMFSGLLDEVRIYSSALNKEQIKALYLFGANTKPNLTPTSVHINENLANYKKAAEVLAFDEDPDQKLKYYIVSGNTSNAFVIDSLDGTVIVNNSTVLDFETNPVFNLGITVADNFVPFKDSTATLTINIDDVNEKPLISDSSINVAECAIIGDTVYTTVANDPESYQTHTFSIVSGNTGGSFNIDNQGNITVSTALDFTGMPSYTLSVMVSDNGSPVLSDTSTITISVTQKPSTIITSSDVDNIVCPGDAVSLYVNGAGSYLWNDGLGTNDTVTVSPASDTSYIVTGTNANGCSITDTLYVAMHPVTTIVFSAIPSLCNNSGAYTLSATPASGIFTGSYVTGNSFGPAIEGVYPITYNYTDTNGCTFSAQQNATVNTALIASAGNDTTLCEGDTLKLFGNPKSMTTYHWTGTAGLDSIQQDIVVADSATPSMAGTYVLNITDPQGCSTSDSLVVSVSPLPGSITGITGSTTICDVTTQSYNATLSSNATSYIWNYTGAGASYSSSTDSVSITFTSATSGNLEVYGVNSCGNGPLYSQAITVNPAVNVSLNSDDADNIICTGASVKFNATSGYSNYAFYINDSLVQNGLTDSISIDTLKNNDIVKVITTGTGGCTDSDSLTFTVNTNPVAGFSTAYADQCSITTTYNIDLGTPTGGTYSGTGVTGTNFDASVAGVGTHSITYVYTDGNGCTGTASQNILVNTSILPTVNINAASTSLCSGNMSTIVANITNGGATPSFQWKVNGTNIGTDNDSLTYIPANGDTVTCNMTSNLTCASPVTVTSNKLGFTVINYSTVSANISSDKGTSVCPATSVTYTANATNGGSSPVYQWFVNGSAVGTDSSIYNYIPSNNDSIWCSVTSDLVCSNSNPALSDTIVMSLYTNPSASFAGNVSVCQGSNANLSINLSGSTPLSFIYTDGTNVDTITGIVTLPLYTLSKSITNSTTYTITDVMDANCSVSGALSTATANYYLNPVIDISGSDTDNIVCLGTSVTYTAIGASTYSWSTGSNNDTTVVTAAGTYTVTGTDTLGCTSSASVTLTVNSLPTVIITSSDVDNTICLGTTDTLTSTGASTYLWNDASTTAVVLASTAGTYSVTGTDINGCTNTASVIVNVIDPDTTNVNASICSGSSYTLPDNSTVSVSGTFPVTLTSSKGCDSVVVTNLSVLASYNINVDASICSGGSYTLPDNSVVTTAGMYSDTLIASNGCDSIIVTNLIVNPVYTGDVYQSICQGASYMGHTVTGNYPDTLVGQFGCDSITILHLTVYPLPVATLSASKTNIQTGDSIVFTAASGYALYSFYKNNVLLVSDTVSSVTVNSILDNDSVWVDIANANNCTATSNIIKIQVKDTINLPPVIADTTFNVTENNALGFVVGNVLATDPEGGLLTYSIVSGNSSQYFSISATGNIIADSALNFEAGSMYLLGVNVSDDSLNNTSAQITINVQNINDKQSVANNSVSVLENSMNGTYVGQIIVSDEDAASSFVHSILTGNETGAFAIDSITGTIIVNDVSMLDFETTPSFSLLIQTKDTLTPYFAVFSTLTIDLVDVFEQPIIADFDYVVDTITLVVTFTDKSSANTTNWYWTYGDGKYFNGQQESHTYTKPGRYSVCLTVVDKNKGVANKNCKSVNVGNNDCSLFARFATQINGDTAIFTDLSEGSPANYYWNFGDGVTSSASSPEHVYETAGYYLVSLSVSSLDKKCTDFYSDFIAVGSVQCRANYSYDVNPTTLNVTFSNTSEGALSKYFWNFGDGTFSVLKNPVHTYKKEGNYSVSLTVSNLTGTCTDVYSSDIQVGVVNCNAHFSYFVDSASNIATFSDVVLGLNTITYYSFGDGETSIKHNPSHKYLQPGYYTVSLSTFNADVNCLDYYEEPILIGSEGIDCEADFTFESSAAGNTVTFTDKSKGDISKHLWNFGDDDFSILPNPSKTYTKSGIFNVCLLVVNTANISNITCKPVPVNLSAASNCFADFDYIVDSATRKVTLNDASIGNPNSWIWNFGDTRSGTGVATSHTYTANNLYLVKLSISNTTNGCDDKTYKLINVNKVTTGLIAAFGFDIQKFNAKAGGYPVDFVGAGLGDQARLRWSFGDGDVDSTSTDPTHLYDSAGVYQVCYKVSDPVTGAEDSACQDITIVKAPDDISRIKSGLKVDIYPVPANDKLTLRYTLTENSVVNFSIVDLAGNNVVTIEYGNISAGSYQKTVDINSLAKGTYILQTKYNNKAQYRLFVKQ